MIRLSNYGVVICALTLLAMGAMTTEAHGNRQGATSATVSNAHVSIRYGRPTLKGRDPMKLIQSGKMWRMGADIATTIESDHDLMFGKTRVPKGKHILLAQMVEPGKWVLVVSSKSAFEYEPGAKIAEVPMKVERIQDPVEEMTIKLLSQGKSGVIDVAWGSSRLLATFTAAE